MKKVATVQRFGFLVPLAAITLSFLACFGIDRAGLMPQSSDGIWAVPVTVVVAASVLRIGRRQAS